MISIDTKKKEQVGLYARKGTEWRARGDPRRVRDHDFPDPDGGKAIPYGVYDTGDNSGFVNVGTDHDTAQFAAESVRRWWHARGRDRYPHAARLLVTCDAGGSGGYRARAWKAELARLAAQTGLEITVCHFPPGTSKWNKIEHRLFCHITRTWRGRPLTSYEVVVNTIAATATSTGLTVTAVLDAGRYPVGAEVTDAQARQLEDRVIARHGFHGDWNYTILPVPRPAPGPGPEPAPGPEPQRTAPDLAALDQPALTGLPPGAAATLAATLAETRLHAARGGRDRQRPPTAGNDSRQKITFTGHILAVILHQRFALPARAIAALFGCDRSTIGHELPRTRQLLTATATAIPPGPLTLATYQDLRNYATAAGITLPDPPGHTPPARHASNPRHAANSP